MRFRAILATRPKDNAVRQELDKAAEATNGVLRATVELQRAFPGVEARDAVGSSAAGNQGGSASGVWRGYLEWARRDFAGQMRALEA